jgi:pre-rRNA-processing protein TSR4
MMTLLLQLNGDLPEKFPGHERKLYIFSCKRKPCRKKNGSVKTIRGVRISTSSAGKTKEAVDGAYPRNPPKQETLSPNLGNSLFNSTFSNSSTSNHNPFSTSTNAQSPTANPFPTQIPSGAPSPSSTLASKPPQTPTNELPATFAEKARVSSPPPQTAAKEPWPPQSSLPTPYPAYYLDADYEAFESDSPSSSSKTAMDIDTEGSSSKDDEKDAFESTIDKTFQKFADRLAQNPEQVLRYEFAGTPLLYSKTDTVGKLIAAPSQTAGNSKITTRTRPDIVTRIPHCSNCSAPRAFEFQLVPQAIAELEIEEEGLEGMEWGTIITYVCTKDCGARGVKEGEVGWLEEWTGVQWEEDAKAGRS